MNQTMFLQFPLISRNSRPKKWCKICGNEAKSLHFGALSCAACATFFRRSVASQRTYACKFTESCELVRLFSRRICNYCRMERCLAVGMQACEVRSGRYKDFSSCNKSTTYAIQSKSQCLQSPKRLCTLPQSKLFNEIAPIKTNLALKEKYTFASFLNSSYENKFCQEFSRMSNTRPSEKSKQVEIFSSLRATILESIVCTAYTNTSALFDYHFAKDQQSLFNQATILWKDMDICNIITRNNDITDAETFDVSDKFVDANLKFFENYYQLDGSFCAEKWPEIFKKLLWQKVLDLTKILENNRLNEYEFAALAHLTLIHIARETLESISEETEIELSSSITKLAKAIEDYYSKFYSAEEKGTFAAFLHMIEKMHNLRKIYNKHILIIFLSQKARTHLISNIFRTKS